MSKLSRVIVAGIAIAGIAASILISRRSDFEFRQQDAILRQQDQQLATLTAEQQRLSNLVTRANGGSVEDQAAELAKLRQESAVLKQQTNELAHRLEQNGAPTTPPPAAAPKERPPGYFEELNRMAGRKPMEARDLALAMQIYSADHTGQYPSNLDLLTPYLVRRQVALSGTNQFEIVYHGTWEQLKGLPIGTIAVVRDQQILMGADGKAWRVYGMAGGLGQLVESADDFKSWEAEHVIVPKK